MQLDEQQKKGRWVGRPRAALLVKLVVWLSPIVITVVATHSLAKAVPRPPGFGPGFLWFIALGVVATGILYIVDKVARRLLPLAALFQLSLVFPDQAPSRYKAALRTQTVHQLKERVAGIKQSGLPDDPVLASETLIELIAALSAHDRVTRGHAERVRAYSRMIGDEMKLEERDVELLQWAGLLHDVGKLFTPSEILNKTSRLTVEEYEVIKLHPAQGAALCEPLRPWLGDWVDAVGQHHEHWDGHGYPLGLAGEEISQAARIVAVADVFDVITSVRSYKHAMSPADGRAELARCADTQFDRNVVRAFLNISLGRLRIAMGPLSWLAQAPTIGGVPLAPAIGGAASVAATAAALITAGVFNQTAEQSSSDAVVEAAAPAPTTAALEPLPPPTSLVVPTTVPVALSVPVAVDDSIEVAEGGWVEVDVGANDERALTAELVEQPERGVVTHVSGTVFRFTSDDDWFGVTAFEYLIHDGSGNSATASVSVTVMPEPDAPVAADDIATVEENGAVKIAPLVNDVDPDGDTLTIKSVITGDGLASIDGTTIHYRPAPNTSGRHTVSYTVGDGTGLTDTAIVAVTVIPAATTTPPTTPPPPPPTTTPPPPTTTPPPPTLPPPIVPHAPVATDDTATTDEDTLVNIAVLANDTDADSDPLTVTSVSSPNGTPTTDGTTIDYTPAPNTSGTHTITYTINDGTGLTDTATVTVTVNPIADAPNAVDDTATTDEDTLVNIAVLANDTDADSDTPTVTSVSSPNGTPTTDGTTIDYTPAPNTSGTHTITYTINDGTGLTDTATVTVTVNPIADAPNAVDDAASVDEDTLVNIAVLANDTDADSDPLTVTSVSSPDGIPTTDGTTIDYTPAANTSGTHTITYTINDGTGLTDTATVTVTVNATPDAPNAVDDTATTDEDTLVNIAVLANDTDADSDTPTVTSVSSPNGTPTTDGTTIDYTPAPNTSGTHTITYTINDGTGLTDTATVTVTVSPTPDAPNAVDDAASVDEDTLVNIAVLANDTDADSDPLTVTSVSSPDGIPTTDGTTIDYTPAPDTFGTHTITYTINDGTGLTDTATVTVTVNATPDAPNAVDDTATTDEDTLVNIAVLANDTDADSDPLTVTSVSSPNGTPTTDGTTIDYTPAPNTSGTHTITYTIDDGTGLTDFAVVTVTVNPIADAPNAVDDAASVDEDTLVNIAVLANDTDADSDPLTVTSVSSPDGIPTTDGTTIDYTPAPNTFGTHTITYTINDGTGLTDTATVTVTVNPTPDAPVAVDDVAWVLQDGTVTVAVLGNDTDVDGDVPTVTLVSSSDGLATTDGTTIDYSPAAGTFGTHAVTYTIDDGTGLTDTATVTITVDPVADTTDPTITPSVAPLPNAAGWNNSPVTVTFVCDDPLPNPSGIQSCTDPTSVAIETGGIVVTGTAVDWAGNTSSVGALVRIDLTPPAVTILGVADGELVFAMPTVSCTATDALSGVAGACTTTITPGPAGLFTVDATATDFAGNVTTETITFTLPADCSTTLPGTPCVVPFGSTHPGDLVWDADVWIFGEVTGKVDVNGGQVTVGSTGIVGNGIDQIGSGGITVEAGGFVDGKVDEVGPGSVIIDGDVTDDVSETGGGDVTVGAGGSVDGIVDEVGPGSVIIDGDVTDDVSETGGGDVTVEAGGSVDGKVDEVGDGSVFVEGTVAGNVHEGDDGNLEVLAGASIGGHVHERDIGNLVVSGPSYITNQAHEEDDGDLIIGALSVVDGFADSNGPGVCTIDPAATVDELRGDCIP